eukprot:15467081-Alexandrium_andersonii.AAC.1
MDGPHASSCAADCRAPPWPPWRDPASHPLLGQRLTCIDKCATCAANVCSGLQRFAAVCSGLLRSVSAKHFFGVVQG